MSWFEVDKGGFKQLMDGKDKSFILRELIQNAFDEPGVTKCVVTVVPYDRGVPYATVTVEDDAPEGFYDISHSYTLFSNTRKRKDASQRGRFNLGEKQVLSLARDAKLVTTTGTVCFNEDGSRTASKQKTARGSIFSASIKMTRAEIAECVQAVRRFLPPFGITLSVNGETIEYRTPHKVIDATLATEFENSEGQWRRTRRLTGVEVHEPRTDEKPMLYEMGLPVVELEGGDKYHYNVMQRVPLNSDRDNVSEAFLRDVRAEVMNAVADDLTGEESAEQWTRDATESDRIDRSAFNAVFTKRYGEKVVSYSPVDPEANSAAAANGYTVLSGGALTRKEWERAREFGTVSSSATTFPTRRPEFSADGEDATVRDWTPGMHKVAEFISKVGQALIGHEVIVRIVRDPHNRFGGWYGSRVLTINLQVMGHKFFDEFPSNVERVLSFVIHELAHEYAPNHLSDEYYRALSDLGAKCVMLALANSRLFEQKG